MNAKVRLVSVLVIMGSVFSPMVFADTANDDIRAEIDALKDRIVQLETKLTEQSKAASAAPAPQEPASTAGISDMMKGVSLSGSVDMTYNYNFNSPQNHANVARIFDRNANEFNINTVNLSFQKAVSAQSPVGFRADLSFGSDAELIGSAGLGSTTDEFDLSQAYGEILLPAGRLKQGLNDIDLKVGKFYTIVGAEAVTSKDAWNTSRGLLFGYSQPTSHTGLLANYVFPNDWDLSLGVTNGWDVVDDNNTAKTDLAHLGLNSIAMPKGSTLTVSLNGIAGPEAVNSNHSYRYLGDVVVTYKTPWKPLTLMYNLDYGDEDDLLGAGQHANWHGHAGYARIDMNDRWSVSGRGEYFNDKDGVRIVSGTRARYWELTGTLEYRPWKNLITRLEYRYDDADQDVFNAHTDGTLRDRQSTISTEAVFVF